MELILFTENPGFYILDKYLENVKANETAAVVA